MTCVRSVSEQLHTITYYTLKLVSPKIYVYVDRNVDDVDSDLFQQFNASALLPFDSLPWAGTLLHPTHKPYEEGGTYVWHNPLEPLPKLTSSRVLLTLCLPVLRIIHATSGWQTWQTSIAALKPQRKWCGKNHSLSLPKLHLAHESWMMRCLSRGETFKVWGNRGTICASLWLWSLWDFRHGRCKDCKMEIIFL